MNANKRNIVTATVGIAVLLITAITEWSLGWTWDEAGIIPWLACAIALVAADLFLPRQDEVRT